MRQLTIDLPRLNAQGRDDFMVSSSNATAMALVASWPDWPHRRLALVGPAGAGKSHLAAIWADEVGARRVAAATLGPAATADLSKTPLVIEDADRGVPEEALFHLWNAMAETGQGLLLTGRTPPSDWNVALPDLASRLASLTPAVIEDPDDALLSIVLVKLFADRQLRVKPALIGYLLGRMERSFAAAQRMVDRLDTESLRRGVGVTQALAREVMDDPLDSGGTGA
ncbi:chromosomal replication initiator DnaA [Jannaschia sp. S6380]|uniref:chromosomal replication initiator DnaA n=1 Tax=Jannaschia sp. S6380 TaxID=2926408 RepID=UPI001FF3CBCA|nr:chromosomal replication initiator DnaA [Jannaschia sp. S6380]MCK0166022.1 chromosomal replication initiator DnaA [Jannaschia sp. S6380]